MGTWATGPFDNDNAADFAADVRDRSDRDARHDLLLATLRAGTEALPKADFSNDYSFGYELEFAVAAAAFVSDEYTGCKKFTDISYARGVGDDMGLLPFVEFHPPSDELISAAKIFIGRMVQSLQLAHIDEEWIKPINDIGFALV